MQPHVRVGAVGRNVSMKSGLGDRNNSILLTVADVATRLVSMKSGLGDRNNPTTSSMMSASTASRSLNEVRSWRPEQ